MDRREFGRGLLSALGVAWLWPSGAAGRRRLEPGGAALPGGPPGTRDALRVDGERLNRWIDELADFGPETEDGPGRVAFSPADRAARAWVRERMREAGLEVQTDAAANLVGRREGREDGRAALMVGSHIDTVPHGGDYDGPVGVLAAIEAARTLHDAGHATRHPLEVVVFQNEEGGKTGSRAMSGEVEPSEMELPTASGKTIGEGIRYTGGDPDRLDAAERSPEEIAAYLELHVEQGAILESADVPIGVVEGIVGIKRWQVRWEGFANHAGTTPMDQRRDALVAAARFVDAVHTKAREIEGRQVATVGIIEAHPGAPNVVPGRVEHTLEIRDLEMRKIDRVFARLREEADAIAAATDTEVSFERFYLSRAAPTDERLRRAVERSADRIGLEHMRMPSGAGHDAQSIALLAPVGMLFVPSVGGISHSPEEYTRPEDVTNGGNVLLHALLEADEQDWG